MISLRNRRLRLYIRSGILFVIAIALGFTIYQVVQGKNTLEKGDIAPDFTLETMKGETVQLSDFRGEGVLLNFWGSWCDPCKKEMPFINEAYKQHIKGVNILAVNIRETPLVVKSFFDQYHLEFPTVLDRKGAVTEAYNIGPIPTTFLIDKDGRIIKKLIGPMSSPEDVVKNLRLIQP